MLQFLDMTRLTEQQLETLADVRRAASRKERAEAQLYALAAAAVTNVPAIHVAEAAGMSRATLYRALGRRDEEAND
jgi:transcriptional regulator of acetoin/glycerol metabolism